MWTWFQVGGIGKDIFERRMATGSDSSSLLLYFSSALTLTKFVLLSVFTFVERVCPTIWAEPPPKSEKISTSGYRPSLKRSLSVGYGPCFVKVFPLLKKQHSQIPIWSGWWEEYCYLLMITTFLFLFRLTVHRKIGETGSYTKTAKATQGTTEWHLPSSS